MTDPLHDFHQWMDGFLCGLNGIAPDEEQWASLVDRLRDLPTAMKPAMFEPPNVVTHYNDGLSRTGGEQPAPVEGTLNVKLSRDQLSRMTGEQAESPAVPRYPDVA